MSQIPREREHWKPLQDPAPWSGKDWALAALLFAALLLIYSPALHGTRLWDDDQHLTRKALQSWAGLARIWFQPGATQQYYPLVHGAFWAMNRIWGNWYTGYHLVNILLHGCSALLLVCLLRRLNVPGAWLAAAFWALHPVQVESVAWMSELKNALSGVFYFSAALLYLRYDLRRKPGLYIASIGLFLAGLLSKSVICTLPAALLLVLFWKKGKLSWRQDLRPLLPFFAIGLGSGLFTSWVEKVYVGASGSFYALSWIQRILIAGRAFWFYLGKLAWPSNLIFSYPHWNVSGSVWWQYLFPLTAVGLFFAIDFIAGRRRDAIFVALLYFVVTLLPGLGFINIYPFRYTYVADHFQYLACAGPLALLAAAIAQWGESDPQRNGAIARAFGLLLLCGLSLLSWRQSAVYRSADVLYRDIIARNPESVMAYNSLGILLLGENKQAEAADDFRAALRVNPNSKEPHENLGNALLESGSAPEAIAEYRKSLAIDPTNAEVHDDLAVALVKSGRFQEGFAEYAAALQIEPNNGETYKNMGIGLDQQGKTQDALAAYRQAAALEPDSAAVHRLLGELLMRMGDPADAATEFQQMIQIDPQNAGGYYALGTLLLQKGDVADAISQFQQALRFDPNDANTHSNLGVALLQDSKIDDGIAECREAIRLNPSLVDAHANLGVELCKQGMVKDGIAEYTQALRLDPRYAATRGGVGEMLLRIGKLNEAIAQFRADVAGNPDDAASQYRLGAALMAGQQDAEALDHLQIALERQPANPVFQNALAWLLATGSPASLRDGARALSLALQASKAQVGNPLILRTLAAAYAQAGQLPDAIQTANRALQSAAANSNPALSAELKREIALYQAGRVYEPPQ